jgi:hypothetical protein
MKYTLEIAARTNSNQSAENKHELLFNFLNNLDDFWGTKDEITSFPGFGTNITAILEMKNFRKQRITFTVFYVFRNKIQDNSFYDDRIYIEFNSKKVDLHSLINDFIPNVINVFDAYRVILFTDKIMFSDFNRSRGINHRETILRFYPVCFYDDILCKKSTGRDSRQLKAALDSIANVSVINNGIYINNVEMFESLEKADAFDDLIRRRLKDDKLSYYS